MHIVLGLNNKDGQKPEVLIMYTSCHVLQA